MQQKFQLHGMLQYLLVCKDESMKSAWSAAGKAGSAMPAIKADGDESGKDHPEEGEGENTVEKAKGKDSRPDPKQKKGRKPRESSTTLQAKWDEMFNRLVDFRRKNGHCLGKSDARRTVSLRHVCFIVF